MAFSKGLPQWGLHLADELERLITLHDGSSIAAGEMESQSESVAVVISSKTDAC